MCGFIGIKNFSDTDRTYFQSSLFKLFHRGPDSSGEFIDEKEKLAFLFRRLSIIDTSDLGSQPMQSSSKRYVIIFNGEIYNYKKLKEEYLGDINFITDSDTEVILEMYKKFKQSCLEYFLGMFSFVIYNKKTKKLFAARDHFGIKPFYFMKDDNKMAFASELKTLSKLIPFSKKGTSISSIMRFQ